MSVVDVARPARSGFSPRSLGDLALKYGVVVAFLVLFVILAIASPSFMTAHNLLNILEQNAPVGLTAVGTTTLLLTRGIDLSIGAIFALSGIVAALVTNAAGPVVGLLSAVVTGVVIGLVNGFICTVVRVNALMTTLAVGIVVGGVAVLVTGGFTVTVIAPGFAELGNGSLLGIEYSVWLFALFAVVGQFVLSRTTVGRKVFAAGGNPEAARLAGIRVGRVVTAAFAISGLGAALGGMIVASGVSQATADMGGNTLMFAALAAVVIGGTSIHGGDGAIWCTVVGVFLLALINNGLNLLGVPPVYTAIVQGAVILLAVAIDAVGRRVRA